MVLFTKVQEPTSSMPEQSSVKGSSHVSSRMFDGMSSVSAGITSTIVYNNIICTFKSSNYNFIDSVNLTTWSPGKFNRPQIIKKNSYISQKIGLSHFIQIFSKGKKKMHKMSKPIFWEFLKNIFQNVVSWIFPQYAKQWANTPCKNCSLWKLLTLPM